ncbi:SDR family oxidoreductase, partial [Streptomyces sp. NPDC051020]|uniref:SDR family oxidoreductase n=1 Tax=Streptomyces sp. NPDC051020 TaxID=3155409 RepID=UPI003426C735
MRQPWWWPLPCCSGRRRRPARCPRPVPIGPARKHVVNMTRAMAIDHGPDNIRVNCVCPGDTATGM